MNFRTVVEIEKYKEKIDYSKKIMLIGSCFTDNIGQKFNDYFFDVDINPFGVIYNPESVLRSLEILTNRKFLSEENLFFDNENWQSYSHHSDFSSGQKDTVLAKINNRIEYSSDFLQDADYLFITFGTAWVYTLRETDNVVANCHKQSASKFNRTRLSVSEISVKFIRYLEILKTLNPKVKVFFTVSPVRHWKDGAIENQISKSTLLLGISEIIEKMDFAHYFPSYEIVMDELRDYRYYDEDMIHISNKAVDYIWERITESLLTKGANTDLKEAVKIKKALQHRASNIKSNEYHLFLEKTLKQIKELKQKNKHIKLEEAEALMTAKLINY
ncbi:MAG: GSCFA domain-containing protein [Bacteroidales bacterium]|nr:GSCFA domain-containing protein [Bacteroidales bacterium]